MARNNLIFGSPAAGDGATDIGLAILRVVAGLALAFFHGIGKVPPQAGFIDMVGGIGFPAPAVLAWVAAAAEFGGGILLALGLLTRPVGLFVLVHFIIVGLMAHAGDPIADRELPMLFGSIAALYMLSGAGRYSVDAVIGRGTRP